MARATGILLLFVSVAALASAQQAAPPAEPNPVDELLAKHYEARGGLEAIKAIESLKMTGSMSAGGFEIPITVHRQRPDRFRFDGEMQGMAMVQAYDGEMAWGTNPMMGVVKPEPLAGNEGRAAAQNADLDGALVEPRKKGHLVELEGKEALDDGEAYRLKVTLRDGSMRTVWLDAETYLESRVVAEVDMAGSPVEAEILFSDYREVAGVKMAHRQVTTTPMGEMALSFSTIEAGVDIDPETFLMPGQEADPGLTLTQVLEKHRTSRMQPGSEQVGTVKASGKIKVIAMGGLELPMTMYFARPNSFRVDIELQGLQMIQAYDGETAWTLSPMQGITEPEALPEEAKDAVAIFSDFVWGLVGSFEEAGASFELAGIEKVERDETYHLRVSLPDGLERQVFLGGEDYLERKLRFSTVFMGSAGELDALLADYRNVGGLVVPHFISLVIGGMPQGEMAIDSVEVGVEVASTIFSMPAPAAEPEPASEGE